jgi:D-arabinose 1-dehydrogenase-like Zn-dependent alcohol dehydrogenase
LAAPEQATKRYDSESHWVFNVHPDRLEGIKAGTSIKVASAGLCGSDVHFKDIPQGKIHFAPKHFNVPFTLGHESAGRVSLCDGLEGFTVGDT